MNIKNNINELNTLIITGRAREAFEKYYSEDVIMQENDEAPTVGKEANRQREKEFYNNLQEFRKAEVLQVGTGEDVSFVMWKYDYTHAVYGLRNYTQISVQHWENNKIIKEQFFYNN